MENEWRKLRRKEMADNNRFGKLSTAEIQEIITNAISETTKKKQAQNVTTYSTT